MAQLFSGLNIFITVGGVSYLPSDLNLMKLEVTDSDEGDNEIEIKCEDNNFAIADSPNFKVGQLLSVKWGYVNSQTSQERKNYVLMKPAVEYTKDGVETVLKAYTKSATLAARQPRKSYGATSVRQIVSEIANRNSLSLVITGGNEKLDSFAMANWSDRTTLRILADRYGYQVSYTSEQITFAPVNYGIAPTFNLVYGQGEDSNIIHASLNVDAHKSHGDAATIATGVDPATKSVKTASGNEADKTVAIDAANGNAWITTSTTQPTTPSVPGLSLLNQITGALEVSEIQQNLPQPVQDIINHISSPDTNNLLAVATGEKLKKQKKKGELSILSVGMAEATCRQLVTVSGLATRDSGNWYAQDVKHILDHSEGYTTDWELTRHGHNIKAGDPNTSPLNKQKAPDAPNVTVPVVVIDASTGKAVTP